MIINASGRCDIVAFYSNWFMNRIKEGYFDVRNPFNKDLVSRIYLEDIDLFFFCTKNPLPIIDKIKDIPKKVYFHITITPYKEDIEPNVPDKKEIIDGVKKLSKLIGKENIVIRYDPVFISEKYTLEYHKKSFERLCTLLEGYTNKVLISFLDIYKNVKSNYKDLKYKELTENDYKEIGISFSNSAKKHGMIVHTCFEERDLVEYGFQKEDCLSKELAYKLTGNIYNEEWKARKGGKCHCVKMADIGVYNSCRHFCKYCYANYDEKQVINNYNNHDEKESLLIGKLNGTETIKVRKK